MKILWIVNMIFPQVSDYLKQPRGVSGGWLLDLADGISGDPKFELAVASVYGGEEFQSVKLGNIVFYLLPGGGKKKMFYSKSHIAYWGKIMEEFDPDLIHLHGTEYSHGLVCLDAFPERRYLLTIQGIISAISREFNADLTFGQKLRYRTLKEYLHLNGMLEKEILFKRNVQYEHRMIQGVHYATGRTFWDEAIMKSINPKLQYFRSFYNLRKEFYEADKWDRSKVDAYTIYGSTAAQAPLKGGHRVLKAISIVKRFYPTVKIRFLMPGSVDGKMPINSGYQKMIRALIQKYEIEENVEFIPSQQAPGVISNMLKCHCAIIPSAMENASCTLREAMHLGVPCIAAYRGGMTDLIDDGQDGLYFEFEESEMLAFNIMRIFESDDLASRLSQNAIAKAERWHDRKKNVAEIKGIYCEIKEREK